MTIPDVSKMTAEQWVMWAAAVLLGFVIWGVSSKLDALQVEHTRLLSIGQIQCYNHAENVINGNRTNQQRRCLTLQLNDGPATP